MSDSTRAASAIEDSGDLRQRRLTLALRGPVAGAARRAAMTELVEADLRHAWAGVLAARPAGGDAGLALAAVGSLARGDLGPASDLDLVLLHDGRRSAQQVGEIADALWYPLWDSGVRIDHSVRSPAQCRQTAANDLAAAVGLLDLRLIAGDAALVAQVSSSLGHDWRSGIRGRLSEIAQSLAERAARSGELAFLLEGDLKEARGGLRDAGILRALVAGWVTDRPHGPVDSAEQRLLDIRDALHTVTGRANDRLLMSEHEAVAAAVGLRDGDELLAAVSECARVIAFSADVTLRRAQQSAPRASRRLLGQRPRQSSLRHLGPGIGEHDGEVVLTGTVRPEEDAVLGLRALTRAAQSALPLSPATVDKLAETSAPLPVPWPSVARETFLDALATGGDLIQVWEAADLAGLICDWIPEWRQVRNRPQRNAVHRHTVDRHQVQAVVEAGAFVRQVSRPDLLLLAALLHDIGKRPGAHDHSITGAPVAAAVARRIGMEPGDVQVIERLVREHLTLIDLATRRDPDDPRTVEELVAAVDGRADILDLLRALTEADARAAGSAAWSPWRARLVERLTERARDVLAGAPLPPQAPLTEAEARFAQGCLRDARPRVQVDAVANAGDTHLVTVVAPDRPGLFADIAGMLSASRLTVRSALVRTVDVESVPIAVDTWYVTGGAASLPDAATLETMLRRLSAGDRAPLDRLYRREAAFRPPKGVDVQPRVVLIPDASSTSMVLEVRAADRPGLLHALGSALASLGLDLRSAHVATHAGQAVDVLYISEADGSTPAPPRVAAAVSALVDAASLERD